jgi:hypothetical protein
LKGFEQLRKNRSEGADFITSRTELFSASLVQRGMSLNGGRISNEE